MRVTLLSKEFPPQLSGIGDYTDHLAQELAARDHRVTVITSPPVEQRESFVVYGNVKRWDASGYGTIAAAVGATKPEVILWQYNPFSIGRHGVALGAGGLARGLARSAPLVVVFHEMWFPWRREGLRGLVWAVTQRIEARAVARAASRCVVTTPQRARLLKLRCNTIPVGANVLPVPDGDDVRAVFGISPTAFVIAHLGSTGPGRDLEPAFEALRRVRAEGLDAHLLLAGNTGPLPPHEGLERAVHVTGAQSHRKLSHALRVADIYLHPDHAGPSAGRRTTIAAALAHGLPVVSYRGPDGARELHDGREILLVDAERDPLAAIFRRLASNPDERRALGQAGRSAFDENFSWTRIGDAFEGVLTDVSN